jgi:hypothetical protein
MTDEAEPVSYMALAKGTPVLTTAGTTIGTVEHVLQIPEEDLFDGIVVKTHDGLRFVDRDLVDTMTTAAVETTIGDDEVAALPARHGTDTYHVDPEQDTGSSLSARFGRMFGRERWIKDG